MNNFKPTLRAATTLAVFLTAASAAHSEPTQYVCTAEHAAGLHFDQQTGVWRAQEFAGKKYTLRRLTDRDRDKTRGKWWPLLEEYPKANWAFFEFGGADEDPLPLSACIERNDSSQFNCQDLAFKARFDKDTRRFEVAVSGAYVSQGFWEQFRREKPERFKELMEKKQGNDPSHPDDLSVEIGNCSPS
jgi:hypothetical protein